MTIITLAAEISLNGFNKGCGAQACQIILNYCRQGMTNVGVTVTSPLWFTIGWSAIKYSTGIHGPQMMKPPKFGDCLTFPLASP